jgi:hypothetical protein
VKNGLRRHGGSPLRRQRWRHGSALPYVSVIMLVMMAICSLVVDFGRVVMVKTELRSAAAAAARAGGLKLRYGTSSAQNAAIAVAAVNNADGTAVSLSTSDIDVGFWDGSTFTKNLAPINAIRVQANRTAQNNNAVSLSLARVVGISTCDVHTYAIAADKPTGLDGLSSLTITNGNQVAVYDSSLGAPSASNQLSTSLVYSNGALSVSQNTTVRGDVILGPSGTSSFTNQSTVTGTTTTIGSPYQFPAVSLNGANTSNNNSSVPLSNNGQVVLSGTAFSMGNNDGITLPGGTYYFTSLSLGNNDTINFSGPATVYVDGPISAPNGGTITAYQQIPGNLKINVTGTNTVNLQNGATLTASLYGPSASLTMNNNCTLYGAAVFDSISFKNGNGIYLDASLNTSQLLIVK